MGYRANWLKHTGLLSTHNESFLHAMDREFPPDAQSVLHAGIRNGGSLEVFSETLGEDALILGLDVDDGCAELPVPVAICDVQNSDQVRSILKGLWFDVIVDSTGTKTWHLWPFLKPGGRYFVEEVGAYYQEDRVQEFLSDDTNVFPSEEILKISVYASTLVVEKRNPLVVPYLDVIVGETDPVKPESFFVERGFQRVIVK